jgi:indolepyruvate ferredoxin oxidoreductase alpha subunit
MTGMHRQTQRILVEKIAEGCGVKYVKVVNPFETRKATGVLKEALQHDGPSVVVFRAACTLMDAKDKRRSGIKIVPARITDKCNNCMACIKLLGCPAIVMEEGKVKINADSCAACGLCISVCPYNAIEGSCAE